MCQFEHSQRVQLQDQLEQLARQHVHLERAVTVREKRVLQQQHRESGGENTDEIAAVVTDGRGGCVILFLFYFG